jgi:hypothetical protein
MHQTKKGNQWSHRYAEGFANGMKVHNRYAEAKGYGVDKDSGLIPRWTPPLPTCTTSPQ